MFIIIFSHRTEIGKQSKNNNGDSKQELMAALCGSTVITNYNHKTYKIDDIDFSISPQSKFEQHGTEVSSLFYQYLLFLINFILCNSINNLEILLIIKLQTKICNM